MRGSRGGIGVETPAPGKSYMCFYRNKHLDIPTWKSWTHSESLEKYRNKLRTEKKLSSCFLAIGTEPPPPPPPALTKNLDPHNMILM